MLKHYFKAFKAYEYAHVVVPQYMEEAFYAAIKSRPIRICPFKCTCFFNPDSLRYRHYVIKYDIKCAKGEKFLSVCKMRRAISQQMSKLIKPRKEGYCRHFFHQLLSSPTHLVDTILYIQTIDTAGVHTVPTYNWGYFDFHLAYDPPNDASSEDTDSPIEDSVASVLDVVKPPTTITVDCDHFEHSKPEFTFKNSGEMIAYKRDVLKPIVPSLRLSDYWIWSNHCKAMCE